jgi:hypothetical protein
MTAKRLQPVPSRSDIAPHDCRLASLLSRDDNIMTTQGVVCRVAKRGGVHLAVKTLPQPKRKIAAAA